MSNSAVLISSGIPAAVFLLCWKLVTDQLSRAMFAISFVHQLVLVFYPTLFSVLTSFRPEAELVMFVQPSELGEVLVGESCFVAAFAISFGFFRSIARKVAEKENAGGTAEVVFLNLLVCSGWIIYVPQALFGIVADPNASALGQIHGWVSSVFWLPSLVACGWWTGGWNSLRRLAASWWAAVPLTAVCIIGIQTGLRGRILWVISIVACTAYLRANWLLVRIAAVSVVLLLPLVAFFGSEYRAIYQQEIENGASSFQLLERSVSASSQALSTRSAAEQMDELLRSVADRAQGPRNSIVLYRDFRNRRTFDLSDLSGALAFPIPRLLYPDKPSPGSRSSSELDSAIFVVMDEAHGTPGYMGPVLASAVAFGQGGWGWLLACGVASGFIWVGILSFARRQALATGAVVVLVMSGSLLIDGLFTPLAPLYALIVQLWKLGLILAIFWFVRLFYSNRGLREKPSGRSSLT